MGQHKTKPYHRTSQGLNSRKRLTELNKSQTWLANEADISPSHLSLLLAGRRYPSGPIRQRLQDVLEVRDFYDLFSMEIKDDVDATNFTPSA